MQKFFRHIRHTKSAAARFQSFQSDCKSKNEKHMYAHAGRKVRSVLSDALRECKTGSLRALREISLFRFSRAQNPLLPRRSSNIFVVRYGMACLGFIFSKTESK